MCWHSLTIGWTRRETILLRQLQGRGAYGMPRTRRLGRGALLRPLLDEDRASIEAYAKARGLEWVEDPSNADLSFDRNFLRRELMPRLMSRWSDAVGRLVGAGAQLAAKDEAGRALAARYSDALPVSALGTGAGAVQVVRWWQPELTASDKQIENLVAQVARVGRGELVCEHVQLRGHRGRIYRVEALPALAPSYPAPAPGCVALPHGEVVISQRAVGFAARGEVSVRCLRPGDRIERVDGSRSVSKLLQQHGVPPWQRPCYPLVCVGTRVVCVPGIACSVDDNAVSTGARFDASWQPDGMVRGVIS